MAKGDSNKANQMMAQDRARQLGEHSADRNTALTRENESYNRQAQTYDPLLTGYKGFAETGGLSDADRERLRTTLNSPSSGGGGGGGGYGGGGGLESLYGSMASGSSVDVDALRVGMPTLKWLMETGGYDPVKEALIQGDISKLRVLGDTGGISATDQERYRGNGVFDEFAKTGGVSDVDKQMLRARGNSGIASLYGQSKNELNRLNQVSGNNSAGTGALLSRLTRDGARAAQDAALNTELGITDRVLEGRKYGASSMSQAEAALQDRLANTKLTGLLGATEHGRGIEEFKGKTKLGSAEAASGVEANIASLLASERARGASGLAGLASAASGDAQASAAQRLGLEKWMLEYGHGNQFAGLEGLGQMNANSLNEGESYRDFILGERGLTGDQSATGIDQRIQNNPRFNWGNFAGQLAGGAAGVGSALIGRPKVKP
jgi:hypothetical protein